MQIALLQSVFSDAHRAVELALSQAGLDPKPLLWNDYEKNPVGFAGFVILEGQPSCENIRALQAETESGKPILGIGAGAKLVAAAGLVPGLENHKAAITLKPAPLSLSASVNLQLAEDFQYNAFTRYLTPKTILQAPVNASDVIFEIPPGLLYLMEIHGLDLFHYSSPGIFGNIAAVSNKAGNVLAIVPAIELAEQGEAIFRSMRDYIASGHFEPVTPLDYVKR